MDGEGKKIEKGLDCEDCERDETEAHHVMTCFFSCVWVAGECQWLHLELIKEMRNFCKTLFPVVEYAYGTIPTYPSGQIGFMLCSKDPVSVLHSAAVSHSSVARLCGSEPTLC